MNSKTKKITTLVVSTVAVIATVVTLLIGAPAYSTGETVETTNSVATTTETMTTQTMTETTTSTAEITTTTTETTTTVETTTETTEVVTTKQTTTFIIETQKPTTEAVLITTEPVVTTTTTTTVPVIIEEYVIYKPATHYIHMNTCRWAASGDVYRIENTEGIEARRCSECNPSMEIITEYIEPIPEPGELTYVKHFTRGTYYAYGGPRKGGSQRQLIDCSIGDGTVKGSIASSYLYRNYGYNYNGKRTMVYLEINGYPQMNGYYYLDDCDAGNPNVIDFFFLYGSNCPFQRQGVVQVDCYIVN